MTSIPTEFRRFLGQRIWRWLVPLLAFWSLFLWLAWQAADLPSMPFVYQVF